MDRLRQILLVFQRTRQADPRLVPLMAGVALGSAAAVVLLGVLTGNPVMGAIVGVLLGLLAAFVVLGRRATSAQLGAIEGRPGAALAVLRTLRGPWHVTPAVAATRKQDLVHRVVGRPGVVLIAEGSPSRVRSMLQKERRRMGRVAGDLPIHEVVVGDDDGQVPLRKLRVHVLRLPRKLKKAQVNALERRLNALGSDELPIPKGYVPRGGRRR
ncbi:MAG TPA: DUF4191 domain-containing protein [Nitriliruptorales bacterium]|nr:DUF4191 domain-containing protein [Nitriliruptorales bacterium]